MSSTLVLTRPLPIRVAAATTLVVIIAWAATNGSASDFGVLAYPAIIALQTAREWIWKLEVSRKNLYEKPGIGPAREIDWKKVESIVMPNAAWWRINPVIKIVDAPNIQLTAADDIATVFELAIKKGKPVEGSADSVTILRSISPWLLLLALASLLLGAQLAGGLS